MKLGILGYGKMGTAIIAGITAKGLYIPSEITVYDPNETAREKAKESGFNVAKDVNEVYNCVNIMIFAIKPQEMKKVLSELISGKNSAVMLLTIAAGVEIATIEQYLGGKLKIARVMPNLPASVGMGASCICYNGNCGDADKETFKNIFSSVGEVYEITESLMNTVVPYGGSFPAYAYVFLKDFIDSAVKRGMKYESAERMIIQSMLGSIELYKKSGKTFEELINAVCSKGGTTIEGVNVLEKDNIAKTIDDCAGACIRRSAELSELLK